MKNSLNLVVKVLGFGVLIIFVGAKLHKNEYLRAMANEFTYKCVNCGDSFPNEGILYLCPHCSKLNKSGEALKGVLRLVFPYALIKRKLELNANYLEENNYLCLLPLKSLSSLPPMQVGNTPLYKVEMEENNSSSVYLKMDSLNPTFSFKDRASALVSAFAKENGIDTIIAASTGNAGSSLAGICASQKQKAIILVPENAPKAKLTQVLMYGAKLIPVKGTYDDAYDLSLKLTEKHNLYNRNTAFNPLTIEGKKTVSFELVQQLKGAPDKVFVSVGDGVILAGVYKGFEDLLEVGLISKMPQIIAVQAEGSSNLIDNLTREAVFSPAHTIADSISVDIPRNFFMARDFLIRYSGIGIKVSDQQILSASVDLARNFGVFAEPAAAAAYAGLSKYKSENKIGQEERIVVLITGNGLKDIGSVSSQIHFPEAVDPNTYHFQ